jgi:hypothetical protein
MTADVIDLVVPALTVVVAGIAVYYARRAVRARKEAEAWAEKSQRHLAEIRRLTGKHQP